MILNNVFILQLKYTCSYIFCPLSIRFIVFWISNLNFYVDKMWIVSIFYVLYQQFQYFVSVTKMKHIENKFTQ